MGLMGLMEIMVPIGFMGNLRPWVHKSHESHRSHACHPFYLSSTRTTEIIPQHQATISYPDAR
jgi:hypothetical protein